MAKNEQAQLTEGVIEESNAVIRWSIPIQGSDESPLPCMNSSSAQTATY